MPTGMTTLRSGYRGPQAGRPPQAPWGWQGEREANEAELGVSFGPNSGAIVHFSTSSVTRPPKRIAARAASQRLPRPFGPRQPTVAAKLRNYLENFGRHTGVDQVWLTAGVHEHINV